MNLNRNIKSALVAGLMVAASASWAQAPKTAVKKKAPAAKAAVATNAEQPKAKAAAIVDQISGQGYGMAGCGLGSIVFGQKKGMIQIIAATVNGTAGSQTFGISSGTSNCVNSDQVAKRTELFIESNQEVLKKEIAQGQGESVSTLATLLQCSDASVLGQGLQQNAENIFRANNSVELYQQIQRSIRSNETLATNCSPAA